MQAPGRSVCGAFLPFLRTFSLVAGVLGKGSAWGGGLGGIVCGDGGGEGQGRGENVPRTCLVFLRSKPIKSLVGFSGLTLRWGSFRLL